MAMKYGLYTICTNSDRSPMILRMVPGRTVEMTTTTVGFAGGDTPRRYRRAPSPDNCSQSWRDV